MGAIGSIGPQIWPQRGGFQGSCYPFATQGWALAAGLLPQFFGEDPRERP
jgi:hypothetical protein